MVKRAVLVNRAWSGEIGTDRNEAKGQNGLASDQVPRERAGQSQGKGEAGPTGVGENKS